jgi:hypothetical protein
MHCFEGQMKGFNKNPSILPIHEALGVVVELHGCDYCSHTPSKKNDIKGERRFFTRILS